MLALPCLQAYACFQGNASIKVNGKRHWIKLQYQAALSPAAIVEGDRAMTAYVAGTRGGIGYVARESIRPGDGVKVAFIY